MTQSPSIRELRQSLNLTLEQFGTLVGVNSRGRASEMERGGPVSLPVALKIEKLSGGRINAADLNADVAAARAACPAPDWALTAQEIDALGAEDGFAEPDRVILCDACDRRLDDPATRGCSYVDCPHVQRLAA